MNISLIGYGAYIGEPLSEIGSIRLYNVLVPSFNMSPFKLFQFSTINAVAGAVVFMITPNISQSKFGPFYNRFELRTFPVEWTSIVDGRNSYNFG